jgi:uncharacterized repeat protein (TIGR04052 family)
LIGAGIVEQWSAMGSTMRATIGPAAPIAALLAGAALWGCGGEDRVPVEVRFAGLVGDDDFACGQTYEGMGSTGADYRPGDFRLFVSEMRLLTASGDEAPVHLAQDRWFQHGAVTLLDFEDGTGSCNAGNAQVNDVVEGSARPDEYTGVRFVVGVPFDVNHLDPVRQPSPMNIQAMHWDWARGYKFIRIDGSTALPDEARQPWPVHTGSDGCDGDARGNVTMCLYEHRAEVELTGFDPTARTIAVDMAALFEDANLEENQGPINGCMGDFDDPDCEPIFHAMGVPFGGADSPGQKLFRVLP